MFVVEEVVFLTGLPRAGGTLLANILAAHPDIAVNPNSSLCKSIIDIKRSLSGDKTLLHSLDSNFDETYPRLENAVRAYIGAWSDHKKKITIDKSADWLENIELVRSLFPQFRMIVCVRDPKQIYASLEKQHRKTLLLDFPDGTTSTNTNKRAEEYFSSGGTIGKYILAIDNLQDVPSAMEHIFFFRYEDLLTNPQVLIQNIFKWIGVKEAKVDLNNIGQFVDDSGVYSNLKLLHKTRKKLESPNTLETTLVSPRIIQAIISRYEPFYRTYYPEYFQQVAQAVQQPSLPYDAPSQAAIESKIAEEIEKELGADLEKEIAKELRQKEKDKGSKDSSAPGKK